jgi:MOSC domain-containing protein YiiM
VSHESLLTYHFDVAGIIESINLSHGGVPKTSALEANVTEHGLSGDHQNDPRYHGGPDRAVVLYSLEVIRTLQQEGHPIAVGSTGENLTVSGVDWASLVPGTTLQIGEVRLQITRYATPCSKVAGSFLERRFRRIDQSEHPGFSRLCARVLTPGVVRPGDSVILVSP